MKTATENVKEGHIYTMPEAFMQDASVPAHWRLLGILTGFFINGGCFWGSNEWLMKRLKCTRPTVSAAFDKLEKLGFISIERTVNTRTVCRARGVNEFSGGGKLNLETPANQFTPNSVKNAVNINPTPQSSVARVEGFFKPENKDSGMPMDRAAFMLMCRSAPQRAVRLVGEFSEDLDLRFKTRGEWRAYGRRNLKTAKRLAPFPDSVLAAAMKKMREDMAKNGKYKWGLETVEKYLEAINQ